MLKKIMAEFNVSENEAVTIYTAFTTNTEHLLVIPNLKERVAKLDTDIKDKELYDKFIEMLDYEGINNRILKQINGYVTISYSKSLSRLLNIYVDIHGLDRIVEVTVNCYKDLIRNQVKSPTILTFFKNEKGSGIDYYLEEEDV